MSEISAVDRLEIMKIAIQCVINEPVSPNLEMVLKYYDAILKKICG